MIRLYLILAGLIFFVWGTYGLINITADSDVEHFALCFAAQCLGSGLAALSLLWPRAR